MQVEDDLVILMIHRLLGLAGKDGKKTMSQKTCSQVVRRMLLSPLACCKIQRIETGDLQKGMRQCYKK